MLRLRGSCGVSNGRGSCRKSIRLISDSFVRYYSSNLPDEPSEMSDVKERNMDPRILPLDRTNSKAWNNVIDKVSSPDIESIYRLRKFLVNPKLRKDLISKVKRQQVPHLVLVDLIKNKGSFPKNENNTQSHIDKALGVRNWNELSEDIETVVTRLYDLKEGEVLTIIGAGVSGLSLAWFVSNARPDLKIRIIEKSHKTGGFIESENINEALFEHGPRTLLPSHPGTIIATQMMSSLGLVDNEQVVGVPKSSSSNAKGLVFNNQLIQLPRNAKDAFKFLFSPIMKGIRFAPVKDFFFARQRKNEINDESLESFISRRFNKTLSDRFISGLIRGIYAGDVSELSARSVTRFNKLYNLERLHGASIIGASMTGLASNLDKYPNNVLKLLSQSINDEVYSGYDELSKKYSVIAVKDGLQTFTNALEKKLTENKNIEIIKNFQVSDIIPISEGCKIVGREGNETDTEYNSSIVISTLSADKIHPLLSTSTKAQELCKKIKFTNLAVVNLKFKTDIAKNWFGFLIPKTEDNNNPQKVLGVIFDSSVRNSTEPIKNYLQELAIQEKLEQQDRLIGMGEFEKQKEEFSISKVKSFIADQFTDESNNVSIPASTTSTSSNGNATSPSTGSTITVMIGGDLWANLPPDQIPNEEILISDAIEALKKYLKVDISPSDYSSHVTYQMNSIPQYRVGHGDIVQEIHDTISKQYDNRLYLSGTSFGKGVGVGDCIIDSLTIASRFSQQRKLLYPEFYINHYLTLTHPSLYA